MIVKNRQIIQGLKEKVNKLAEEFEEKFPDGFPSKK
jgi:hypothetical protein